MVLYTVFAPPATLNSDGLFRPPSFEAAPVAGAAFAFSLPLRCVIADDSLVSWDSAGSPGTQGAVWTPTPFSSSRPWRRTFGAQEPRSLEEFRKLEREAREAGRGLWDVR